MKAGQLIKILETVDPRDEVYFTVGYDKEYRKDILEAVGNNPDIMADLVASGAKLMEVSKSTTLLQIILFPIGETPADINDFCDNHAKARTKAGQGDNS